MAITTDTYWTLSLSFQDRNDNVSHTSILLSDAIVLDDVVAALDGAFGALFSGISDATLVGYNLSRGGRDYTAAAPGANSEVERKGSFSMLADNGQTTTMQVPSIRQTLVTPKTNQIDVTSPAVAAFIAYLEGGIVGVAQPVTNAGANIVKVTRAEQTHRGSSKG